MQSKLSPRRWAQERNFTKMRLSAVLATLKVLSKNSILIPAEQRRVQSALSHIEYLLKQYKGRNIPSKFNNT
jgi:hypothetical protein